VSPAADAGEGKQRRRKKREIAGRKQVFGIDGFIFIGTCFVSYHSAETKGSRI
jgi:hypothetical protein